MISSVFPDLNVWVALTVEAHQHHNTARAWYDSLPANTELIFSRFTQLGFLRLLTTPGVVPTSALNQRQAWEAYDTWMQSGGCSYREEPFGIEIEFRAIASLTTPSPREWADSFLAAYAAAASLELVTFDKALALRAGRATLLHSK